MLSSRSVLGAIAAVGVFSSVIASPAVAADVLTVTSAASVSGTVDYKFADGHVEVSAPLWNGQVPTGVRIPVPKSSYSSCVDLSFSVQAALPVDQMKDVDVTFEIWTATGSKVMSDYISGYSGWNPSGGPTQVTMTSCDPFPEGNYNLFVTTQNELSTNGLLSRYVEGKQTFTFTVSQSAYVKCKKSFTTKIVAGKKCASGWKKVRV